MAGFWSSDTPYAAVCLKQTETLNTTGRLMKGDRKHFDAFNTFDSVCCPQGVTTEKKKINCFTYYYLVTKPAGLVGAFSSSGLLVEHFHGPFWYGKSLRGGPLINSCMQAAQCSPCSLFSPASREKE